MKLIIPHIHKTLGDTGFFARISQKGEIKELRVKVLEGLRQIEGILIGRRIFEAPMIISRTCGICPTSHILNACVALEKALGVKTSRQTDYLRKLINSAQIIQSHSLHIFFMSLTDFLDIKDDFDLMKKFSRETKAVLQLRNFALSIIGLVGGRTVHPITPIVGGFSKIPQKQDIKKALEDSKKCQKSSLILINLFKNLDYPQLKRKTDFCSSFSEKEYLHCQGEKIKVNKKVFSTSDFFSNQIEEDLKTPPAKRVKFQGKTYMLGAIARIKNNKERLDSEAKSFLKDFQKKNNLKEKELFENNFYNTFYQSLEILHFLREVEKNLTKLLKEKEDKPFEKYKIKEGKGLAVLEAPRGTLFSYLEIDKEGRIANCSIITPTAQFLGNLEEDLKVLLIDIKSLSKKEKLKKIKTLIRAYDPCISCAVH